MKMHVLALCVSIVSFSLYSVALADSSPEGIVLPTALDPSHHVYRLDSGTKVYAIPVTLVKFFTTDGSGKRVLNSSLVQDVANVSRTPTATIVTHTDGTTESFPANAEVSNSAGHGFAFVSPGMTIPKRLQGQKPDYIVP